MLIWIIFAAMTGAAVMAVLWPLGRRAPALFADAAGATALYRAQVAEIDRDLGRKLIGASEAEAAKAEAARRLLRATAEDRARRRANPRCAAGGRRPPSRCPVSRYWLC